mgnify:CR=1 FL=1
MRFILIADDENLLTSFFPLWQVITFVGVVSLLLFFLFPQHLLEKTLGYTNPSPAVLNYLQAFKTKYPQNIQISLATIEQEINLGLIKRARENIALLRKNAATTDVLNQARWLDYLIVRYKAYHTKLNTSRRIMYLQQLRQMLVGLKDVPLKPEQLQILAVDSLNVAQATIALKIYNHLYEINALKTPEEFALGGNIAMQNNMHLDSAKFYRAAYERASNNLDKRKYALEVLKVLWAGNFVQEALSFAKELPDAVIDDRDTLAYLSRLALAANRADLAEKYALRALLINANRQHE